MSASVCIIGGGVVGTACAYALSRNGYSVIVLEREQTWGDGITSRNSGVIHAGIYYPRNSLKAQSCIRGKALLYEWCESRGVPHQKVGKWVIGQAEDTEDLERTFALAREVEAPGLRWATDQELEGLRNLYHVSAALFSSETGIVDPIQLTRSLMLEAQERGASFFSPMLVRNISVLSKGSYRVETDRGDLDTDIVINAAGLYADEVSKMVGVDKYKIYPCRGHYFWLRSQQKYKNLIYPAKKPNAPGLGVHLTLSLDDQYRLGPDVEWPNANWPGDKRDFSEPENLQQKAEDFFRAASRYLKGIRIEQLSYESCGIRPKLRAPTESVEKDFVLSQDLPGFINLVGIESPGLTAALDLAERVATLLK